MMRVMKKSIGDNMIPKDWAFERGLDLVKKSGFDGIELWLGDVPWFQMTTTDTQVRELRRKVENAGLVVSNVSTGLHWASPLSARDPTVRAQAVRIVEREIETAVLLGSDAILLVAGLVTEEVPYNEVYQRCVESLKPLGEKAARAGVRIGCENCNAEHRFLISPREFRQFLNDVNSAAVGIHLDVGNIHDTGFAEQWIEIHGPKITRIHLKDVLKHRGRCGDQSVYTDLDRVRELQLRAALSDQPARILAVPQRREQCCRRDSSRRRQHPRHRICRAVDRDPRAEDHAHSSKGCTEAPRALRGSKCLHESRSGARIATPSSAF